MHACSPHHHFQQLDNQLDTTLLVLVNNKTPNLMNEGFCSATPTPTQNQNQLQISST